MYESMPASPAQPGQEACLAVHLEQQRQLVEAAEQAGDPSPLDNCSPLILRYLQNPSTTICPLTGCDISGSDIIEHGAYIAAGEFSLGEQSVRTQELSRRAPSDECLFRKLAVTQLTVLLLRLDIEDTQARVDELRRDLGT